LYLLVLVGLMLGTAHCTFNAAVSATGNEAGDASEGGGRANGWDSGIGSTGAAAPDASAPDPTNPIGTALSKGDGATRNLQVPGLAPLALRPRIEPYRLLVRLAQSLRDNC
jgi:hypothetical protein